MKVKRSEYYNDWLRPQESQITGWGSVLYNDSRRFLAISSTLRERDADSLDDDLRQLMQDILPHVQRAFRLAGVVARQSQVDVQSWLDMLDGSAFALDVSGAIVGSNARALETSQIAAIAGQRLVLRDSFAQSTLERIVRDIGERGSSQKGTISVVGPSGDRWSGLVTPVPPVLPVLLLQGYLPRRAVALVVLRRLVEDAASRLRRRYSLSIAETEVAMMLARGTSVAEIAAQREASVHTVRNQLRSVFDKTGVNRQTELIRLVLDGR